MDATRTLEILQHQKNMGTRRQAVLFLFLCLLLILMSTSSYAADYKPEGHTPTILAIYWGQNGEEGDLEAICATTDYNIVSIELLPEFGHGQTPALDLVSHCNTRQNHNGCKALSKAIKACQERGIKVLLSFSGYSPASADDAKDVAYHLWHNFLGGGSESSSPPFGGSAISDGIHFSFESGDDGNYWGAIAIAPREFENLGRRIYLAMPLDCTALLEAQMDVAIKTGVFDFLWVDHCNNNPSHVTSNFHVFLGLPPAAYEASQNGDFVSDHLLAFHMLQIANYLLVVIWLAIKLNKA